MKFLKRLVFVSFLSASLFAPVSIQWTKGGSSFQTESSSPSVELNSQKIVASSFQVNKEGLSIDPAFAYADDKTLNVFGCGKFAVGCEMMNLIYYLGVIGGNFIAALSGLALDFFLNYSIQSTSYLNDFIKKGWELLRDITNIVFIFALLYQAFQLVLGSSASASKKIVRVILVALTINFSLYMSFFVIDVSNLLAHSLYNSILSISKKIDYDIAGDTDPSGRKDKVNTKSPSLAIASKINPQKTLFAGKNFSNNRTQGYILLIIAIGINIALITVFLKVTLLFLGRTIGLWIATIISPLAFSSLLVPKMENMSYIGFDRWLKSLLNMAFMAPIFIFFLLLVLKFSEIQMHQKFDSGSSLINETLATIVAGGIVITLILLSEKVAKSMSGDFAGIVADYAAKGLKMAVAGTAVAATGGMMLASGGAAMIGRGASFLGKKAGDNKIGRGLTRVGSNFKNGSKILASTKLDLTKLPGFSKLAGPYAKKVQGFTGHSLLGHVANLQKYRAKHQDDVFDVETDKIGQTKVDTARIKGKRDYLKNKSEEDWKKEAEGEEYKWAKKMVKPLAEELAKLVEEKEAVEKNRNSKEDELIQLVAKSKNISDKDKEKFSENGFKIIENREKQEQIQKEAEEERTKLIEKGSMENWSPEQMEKALNRAEEKYNKEMGGLQEEEKSLMEEQHNIVPDTGEFKGLKGEVKNLTKQVHTLNHKISFDNKLVESAKKPNPHFQKTVLAKTLLTGGLAAIGAGPFAPALAQLAVGAATGGVAKKIFGKIGRKVGRSKLKATAEATKNPRKMAKDTSKDEKIDKLEKEKKKLEQELKKAKGEE